MRLNLDFDFKRTCILKQVHCRVHKAPVFLNAVQDSLE